MQTCQPCACGTRRTVLFFLGTFWALPLWRMRSANIGKLAPSEVHRDYRFHTRCTQPSSGCCSGSVGVIY
jgi:hypothetical protein